MKIDILHMPDGELELMRFVWRQNRPVTAAEIALGLPSKKWKPAVIHTLAMRLFDKGLLKYYRTGGKNHYLPYIEEADYTFVVSKVFVNEMHNGSLVEMVRTLLYDRDLPRNEIKALRELLDSWEKENMAEAAPPPLNEDLSDADEEQRVQEDKNSTCFKGYKTVIFFYKETRCWNNSANMWNRCAEETADIFLDSA